MGIFWVAMAYRHFQRGDAMLGFVVVGVTLTVYRLRLKRLGSIAFLAAALSGAGSPRGVAADTATAVSAGESHACAITVAGGLKCWGYNGYGQLGDGTTTDRNTPVDVVGLTSGVVAVSAGDDHTCAITSAGGLKCWGSNNFGQLGDGTTTDRNTPVDVAGLASGVVAVAAGGSVAVGGAHTCAITSAGGLKCWGYNGYGQLGDGTWTDRSTAVNVVGLTSGVVAVAAGGKHTCAITSTGRLKCWGYDGSGQLGDGGRTNLNTPANVVGLTSGVVAVTGGYAYSCAVTGAGGLKCWGENGNGQLGDGTTTQRSTPVDVVGLTSGVVAVAAGNLHSCAITSAGSLKCWGTNYWGQVGDGTTTDRNAPVDVAGLPGDVIAVASGHDHTCAISDSAGVTCWGNGHTGQLGNGISDAKPIPARVVDVAAAAAISGGYSHTCAITGAGGLKCWGSNYAGQLGDGTQENRSAPVDVVGLTSGVVAVSAGASHTCAITSAGGLKCWGDNGVGQLGDGGAATAYSSPVDVVGLTSGVVAVAAGHGHTCAITSSGALKCWGSNFYGELGDGTTTQRSVPADVSGMTSNAAAVAAGMSYTCAITSAGGVKCWGYNGYGQLGDGTTTDRSVPVDVTGLASGVTAISAGDHACAITSAGGLKCWGDNYYGQLGDGTTSNFRRVPVDVAGLASGAVAVAAGGSHTCAITSAGGAKCWGYNRYGDVGDGTTTNRSTPADVVGLSSGVLAIAAANGYNSCSIDDAGGLDCWGNNGSGQIGIGDDGFAPVPVAVLPEPAFALSLVSGAAVLGVFARRRALRSGRIVVGIGGIGRSSWILDHNFRRSVSAGGNWPPTKTTAN
jgi:alpha-tubulin suppressor-like RCC1 family protein